MYFVKGILVFFIKKRRNNFVPSFTLIFNQFQPFSILYSQSGKKQKKVSWHCRFQPEIRQKQKD